MESLRKSSFSDAEKAEIKAIVHEALSEYFRGYGSSTIMFITQAAIVLGSVTTIVFAIKTIASWFGVMITRS